MKLDWVFLSVSLHAMYSITADNTGLMCENALIVALTFYFQPVCCVTEEQCDYSCLRRARRPRNCILSASWKLDLAYPKAPESRLESIFSHIVPFITGLNVCEEKPI